MHVMRRKNKWNILYVEVRGMVRSRTKATEFSLEVRGECNIL